MRKARLILAAAAAGALLTGCSGGKSAFSPEQSCVYVSGDGTLRSALVLESEEDFEESELKEFLEGAVSRFNEKSGGDGEEGPVTLASCTADQGVMTAVFEYRDADALVSFRQSDENEDNSNTFSNIEVKSAAEAGTAGWLSGEFIKADGSQASGLDAAKEKHAAAVSVQGGGVLETEGELLYVSSGAQILDSTSVKLPDGETSVVVFKEK